MAAAVLVLRCTGRPPAGTLATAGLAGVPVGVTMCHKLVADDMYPCAAVHSACGRCLVGALYG